MPYLDLTLKMDMGVKSSTEMITKQVRFGDGYKQLYSFGINNKVKNWNGSKTGDYFTVIKPLEDFFNNHAGVIPFYWIDPTGAKRLYTCTRWDTAQNKANIWQISLSFELFIST